MSTPTRMQLAIGLILAFTCSAALGAEPNQPTIPLRFVERAPRSVEFDKRPPIMPSHQATFATQWRFEPTNEPNASDLLKTSAGKSLSILQRELLKTEQQFWLHYNVSETQISRQDMPYGSAIYRASAVSKEDARKMARAVVEFLIRDEEASVRHMKKRHIEKLSRIQDELKGAIAGVEEQIKAKGSEVPAAYKKYEDAIRNSPYSLHPSSQVPDEVRKTIFEMNKMLDVLNIEIAGIQSKLSAIKKYSDQKDVLLSQTLMLTLREMAIRQEIELVGAESRRQAIMTVKRREEALYSQYEAWRDLKTEIETLKANVKREERKLRDLDREIDFLGTGELTFIIDGRGTGVDNVTIQSIRVKEQR